MMVGNAPFVPGISAWRGASQSQTSSPQQTGADRHHRRIANVRPLRQTPIKPLSPWIWIGVDDFAASPTRDAYRRAERAATEKLRNQQLDFQRPKAL